jgi:hypothetical protein
MLDFHESKKIAEDYLHRHFASRYGDAIIILEERTMKMGKGWLFRFQHRRHLETGKDRVRLIGCGPLLVDQETHKIVVFPSFGTNEHWHDLYLKGKVREDAGGTLHLLFREGDCP